MQGVPRDCGPPPQVYHMDPAHPDRVTPPPAPQYPQHSLPLSQLPLRIEHNAAYATVTLGSLQVEMLVDSGSTSLFLPISVARQLLAKGEATEGPDGETTLADGSVHPNKHILIGRITLAGHVLHDVMAGVGDERASLLLGFDVLSQVSGKFTVAANNRLIFE
jgi:hypothetical protein